MTKSKIEICLRVWRAQDKSGYVFISSKANDGKWEDYPQKFSPNTENEVRNFIAGIVTLGRDVYWCPNIFSQSRRRRDYVEPGRFLYADLDIVDPREVDPHLKPTIAWKSSNSRYQALWELEEPLEPAKLEVINKRLTYTLDADKSGWDLTQVLRIPGSTNYKYKPPQRGELLWNDGPVYKLEDLSPYLEETESNLISQGQKSANFVKLCTKYRGQIPTRIMELLQYPPAQVQVGKRSSILWKLEHELIKSKVPLEDVVELIRLSSWNKYSGRRDEQERIYTEVGKVYDNIVKGVDNGGPDMGDISLELLNYQPIVKPIREYLPQEIHWLWYPYIPKGGITILDGDPGIGKTYLALALAAHLSAGIALPGEIEIKNDSHSQKGPKISNKGKLLGKKIPTKLREGDASQNGGNTPQNGVDAHQDGENLRSSGMGGTVTDGGKNVLYLTAEDDPGLTLRPRLELMGANIDRIFVCEGIVMGGMVSQGDFAEPLNLSQPSGLNTLDALFEKYKPALVVIDPFVAFIGHTDLNKANEVRPVMVSLATLARRHDLAIVLVRHLTKGARDRIIYRGMGTIDLIAAARSALLVANDPDNPDVRIVFHQKHNLSKQGASLGFVITEEGFRWIGEMNISPIDLLRPDLPEEGKTRKRDEAVSWLEDFLSQYPQGISAKAVKEEAKERGFSESTLHRAKNALKIKTVKSGQLWVWKLK